MLAYAWYLTFTALGTPRDALSSKTTYFHMVSWVAPLVLTIVCLAISEIDGDSVSGICFIGGINHGIRATFVLLPVGLVIIVGTFFLVKGVYTLVKIRKEAPMFIPEKTFSKIRDTIYRLGIFTIMALVFVLITFSVHVYIFANEQQWKDSFRDYMLCIANVTVGGKTGNISESKVCTISHKPSLVAMEIHIFAFFGAGIAMSSWSWTRASLSAWERFFRWVFHKPSNKPVKLKRHRMIAQAFEKRREINQGRVSISYCSSHDDPLGMKFDLNSGSDDELSSNFALAMPKLVQRRGGLIHPGRMIRRYSDSDVQSVISTRRVSLESQVMEFREAQYVFINREQLDKGKGKRSRKKMKGRKRHLNRIHPGVGPLLSNMKLLRTFRKNARKASDSSVISQMSAKSICISVERQPSLDTASLTSNQDIILPAITKSSENDATDNGSVLKAPSSKISEPPSGVAVGLGECAMKDASLPGVVENEDQSSKQANDRHGRNKDSENVAEDRGKQKKFTQIISSSSKSKEKSSKFKIATTNLSGIPFSPLMADIGEGNWGVLLGKSGSSSGSEAGMNGLYRDGFVNGWNKPSKTRDNRAPPKPPRMGVNSSLPHNRQRRSSMAVGMNNQPYLTETSFMPPNYGYPGFADHYNGYLSGYSSGGGVGHMASAGYGQYLSQIPSYNLYNSHFNYPQVPVYPTAKSSIHQGGARPKVRENMGHVPNLIEQIPGYLSGDSRERRSGRTSKQLEQRRERERTRERQMRRHNQMLFNSTFEVDEDGIESISA